ncbi:MAG: (2Fe-2S)-binding protein [Burkholderiales bacterium]|nr:(2Fe-2S)-binding protein [Burkholderiales bacterium]
MQITINGQLHTVMPVWADERLLHLLRESLGLVGAKFGCGLGQCGACTVLVDGQAQRSCLIPVKALAGRAVTTVEGLSPPQGPLHSVQQAWLDEAVPQCGFCQSGQIMATVALLRRTGTPDEAALQATFEGHLCRCGTQQRVRRAVLRAARSGVEL